MEVDEIRKKIEENRLRKEYEQKLIEIQNKENQIRLEFEQKLKELSE